MNLEALDRSASQFGFSEWGSVIQTFITCAFNSPGGVINVNLTQTYDYIPPTVSWARLYTYLGTNFLDRNKKTRASLWWGESALSNYYVALTRVMQDIRENTTASGNAAIRKGTVYFAPNNNSTINIKNLEFFNIDFRFIIDYGLGRFDVITPGNGNESTITELDQAKKYPDVWTIVDSLAKSAYSVVLTDLGQIQTKSNFLSDVDDLEYFTSSFASIGQHWANAHPGPEAKVDYLTAKNETGPLGTTPSIIAKAQDYGRAMTWYSRIVVYCS
ncbi:hypothetical protein TSTA_000880 [Talaromyces stipitatus ATCC 10500]|uniref:Uncharacterized protein n=1 Tax=Talaromyces stipitatus (strain ATCC 10500 / CBS 375.48 / QM 6759 / NRRL 1006) TaxID=441959 RepID=B8MSV7_TALSN|nr:uncharacterized protein TSTA_000880 [Talaromyces stipitatus ATCC 10500]EED12016.1 hypothetical protein TSTA_000880 [Talaromyces stipitatus ATCC 10500]